MRKPTKKQTIIAASAIAAILLLIALTRGGEAPLEPQETRSKTVDLIFLNATSSGSSAQIVASGRVRAAQEASLVSEGAGVVSSVNASIGKTVQRGEVLITLSNPDAVAQVAQARAALASAESSVSSSQVGYSNSRIAAADSIENALIRSTDVLYSKLSSFYSNPARAQGFGVRIEQDSTVYYIEAGDIPTAERIRSLTEEAANNIASLEEMVRGETDDNLASAATAAENALVSVRSLLEAISAVLNRYQTTDAQAQAFYDSYKATVSASLTTVNTALTTLRSSMQAYNSALVSSSGASADQARAALAAAEAQLAKTVIRAPFSGRVLSTSVQVGEYVTPGTPVVSLIDSSSKEAIVFLTSEDARRIEIGSRASVSGKYEGTVIEEAPGISAETGKVEAVISLPNDPSIVIGEYVDVAIAASKDDASNGTRLLPLKAVKMTGSGAQVFVVDDGMVAAHPVVVGNIQGDRIEVVSGLESVNSIIANTRGLSIGDMVTVR